jgi:hypothetical protein
MLGQCGMSSTPHKLIRPPYMGSSAELPAVDAGWAEVLTAGGGDEADSWERAHATTRATSRKPTVWYCRRSCIICKPTLRHQLEKSHPYIDIQWNSGSPGSKFPIIPHRSTCIGPQFIFLGLPIFSGNIYELSGNSIHQGHHSILDDPQIDERVISWYRTV